MRIISKFNDYYDSCRGYGADPKLLYVRDEREVQLKSGNWHDKDIKDLEVNAAARPLSEILGKMPHADWCTEAVISFCGKAHPVYLFSPDYVTDQGFYSPEELVKFLRKQPKFVGKDCQDLANQIEKRKKKKYRYWYYYCHYGNLTLENWERFADEVSLDVGDAPHIFFKSPVLLRVHDKLIVNPQLRKYNFAKAVDPYTAFQELSMYVGNNLANQMDPEVHVSDDIKRDSRGFDKWSFKKHPADNKKPRRKKKG